MTSKNFTVKKWDNIGHSPAWNLVPVAGVEINSSDIGFGFYQLPAYNDAAMVAVNGDGKAVGFMAYRYDDTKSGWFIMLAWVSPEYRRNGVHTAMFDALVERARHKGDITTIDSGTHINNLAAQRAFERQGRRKTAVMYTYVVKDFVDGTDPV